MKKKIVAVIVTYNRKELLLKSIQCIKNQTKSKYLDILIVDNNSEDGTFEAVYEDVQESNLIYCNTGANLGGAGGFNYGIRKAVELGYKYVWVMDDDTLPHNDALEEFLKVDRKYGGKYGFLSSKVLWKDGTICSMNIQKINKWKKLKNFQGFHDIQYASFVSLFLRTAVIKKVGLPYKEFFIWADDWEYTRRISKKYKCYYVPKSIVDHMCNTNVGANIIDAPPERTERFKYMFRNDVVMYRQDGLVGMLYLFVRNLFYMLKIFFYCKSGKREKLDILRNSTKDGMRFYPEIEYIKE